MSLPFILCDLGLYDDKKDKKLIVNHFAIYFYIYLIEARQL